jgi:hypothetical protein
VEDRLVIVADETTGSAWFALAGTLVGATATTIVTLIVSSKTRQAEQTRLDSEHRHQRDMAADERNQRRREDAYIAYLDVVWSRTNWAHELMRDFVDGRTHFSKVGVSNVEVRAAHALVNAFGSQTMIELSRRYENVVGQLHYFVFDPEAGFDRFTDEESLRDKIRAVANCGDEIIHAIRDELGSEAVDATQKGRTGT